MWRTIRHARAKFVVCASMGLVLITWALLSNGTAAATDNKATKEATGSNSSREGSATPTYTPTAVASTTSIVATRTAKATVTARAGARGGSQDSPDNVSVNCPAYNPTAIPTQPNGQRELTGFYVYLDPGHGGTENNATGPNGTLEKCWVLNIGLDLGNILRSHGAQVFYSRTDDSTVPFPDRYQAANRQYRVFYPNTATPVPNWKLISIHLNAPGVPTVPTGQPTNTPNRQVNRTEVYFRCQLTPVPPTPGYELAATAAPRIGRVVQGTSSQPLSEDFAMVRCTFPLGHNILTESAFLTNPTVEARFQNESGFIYNLANEHYRSLVDFWLTGYEGIHQGGHPEIVAEYWSNINAGKDPGVPLSLGPYYVHRYPAPTPGQEKAWTQEFVATNGTRGSILECIPQPNRPCPPTTSPAAYYVRSPIWDTFIQKGGPNTEGPGRPWGGTNLGREHSWTTTRGVQSPLTVYVYPKTQNFENGAIFYNQEEGQTAQNQNPARHAIFIPNCGAYDINSSPPDLLGYVKNMVGRFAISNDAAGPTPQPTPLPGYNDGGLHANDPATRAQLAQSLIWAEGFPYYTGVGWEYNDIQNHWGRPYIRIAANRFIANGYNDQEWRPDSFVTRGQFAKMETVARGWTLINPSPTSYSPTCPFISGQTSGYRSFSDVCYGSTFYQHIETVKAHNAIGGYSGSPPCDSNAPAPCFKPNNNVTRAQMSKIIDEALRFDGYPAPTNPCWGNPFP